MFKQLLQRHLKKNKSACGARLGKILITVAVFVYLSSSLISADELLEKVDNYRGLQGDFSISIKVTSPSDGKTNEMKVYARGNRTLVKFESPARDRGRIILNESSKNLWISIPARRNIIRISPVQRLIGEVSIGDIASVNLNQNYKIFRSEDIGDNRQKLYLEAGTKEAQYGKIELLIVADSALPVRADFFSKSGRLLKRGEFKEFSDFDGRKLLSRMKITDAIQDDRFTEIYYSDYKEQNFPDDFFTRENINNVR